MEMNASSASEWAVMTYGSVMLGDERRTQRAVKIAHALARDPMASLPKQLGGQAATKAGYRFLESAQTSYEQLMRPHLQQTKALMQQQQQRVLLIQDMTEVDYEHHPKTRGLGPIGNGNHQGYLLQTVLAVEPTSKQVLGIAAEANVFASARAGRRNEWRARHSLAERVAGVATTSPEHWSGPPRM